MSKPRVYLFLDTNVFMHFDMFDEIDWPALVDGAPVVLCVARIVVVELDKHKTDHKSSRKRERARKVLARFRASPAEVRPRVALQIVRDYPARETAPARLDLARPDDTLIASVLEFRERFACDARIVSNDTGVLLTAEAHGLLALDPPEGNVLPPEPDETEGELRKARSELVKLQSKRPKLVLRFRDGAPVLGVTIRLPPPNKLDAGSMFHREIVQLPPHQRPPSEWFRETLHEYCISLREHRLLAARTVVVQVDLANEGTAPADDIHVRLTFPGWLVPTSESLVEPKKPEPGDEFASALELASALDRKEMVNFHGDPEWEVQDQCAELAIERVKQNLVDELPKLYLRPHGERDWESFPIAAMIVVGSPPETLHTVLQVEITNA